MVSNLADKSKRKRFRKPKLDVIIAQHLSFILSIFYLAHHPSLFKRILSFLLYHSTTVPIHQSIQSNYQSRPPAISRISLYIHRSLHASSCPSNDPWILWFLVITLSTGEAAERLLHDLSTDDVSKTSRGGEVCLINPYNRANGLLMAFTTFSW